MWRLGTANVDVSNNTYHIYVNFNHLPYPPDLCSTVLDINNTDDDLTAVTSNVLVTRTTSYKVHVLSHILSKTDDRRYWGSRTWTENACTHSLNHRCSGSHNSSKSYRSKTFDKYKAHAPPKQMQQHPGQCPADRQYNQPMSCRGWPYTHYCRAASPTITKNFCLKHLYPTGTFCSYWGGPTKSKYNKSRSN